MKRKKQWHEVIGDVVFLYIIYKDTTYTVKFDKSELFAVIGRRWSFVRTTSSSGRVYLYANNRSLGLLHRYLTEAPQGLQVDHINHDTLDNRKENLRFVTSAENRQNIHRESNNRSGIRGIKWYDKTSRWRASFFKEGKERHVGFYKDLEEAKEALRIARAKYLPFSQEALANPELASDLSEFNDRVRSDSTSGVKGIGFIRNRWRVRFNGKQIGTFKELEEAKRFLEDYKLNH